MSEQIIITSNDGILTVDVSRFHNDKKLDKILEGIIEHEDPIMIF